MHCSITRTCKCLHVLATSAHEVYSVHLGRCENGCRLICATTVPPACRQCAAQMRRSPTLWPLEDTAHNRTAAHAIDMPILRLNQLQPGGCTQLHHLSEDMLLRAAARPPSSWSHWRAPTYRPPTTTQLPLYKYYAQTPFSPVATLGCKRLLPEVKGLQRSGFRNRGHRWHSRGIRCMQMSGGNI